MYEMDIQSTPVEKIQEFYEKAKEYLDYVYLGNVASELGRDTVCPKCGKTVVSREGYFTKADGLDESGNCKYCGTYIMEN